jgi:hypothetical protein
VQAGRHAYLGCARCTPKMSILLFAIVGLFVGPLVAATALHFARGRIVDWRNADRSSAGLLPAPLPQTEAVVRIFSARAVRWRGIVATHSLRGASPSGLTGSSQMAVGLGVRLKWSSQPTVSRPST